MRHTREEVIERTIREFARLDQLVNGLSDEAWNRPLRRPEGKDPWTVKDALVHITHWKANTARVARKQRRPLEEPGLEVNDYNHLIYERWHDRSPHEVLAWHRQVQEDLLTALSEAQKRGSVAKSAASRGPLTSMGIRLSIGSKTSSGRSHIQPGTSPPGNAPTVSMLRFHQERGKPDESDQQS